MKFQDELNSKIWENNELKLEVADKLDEIASAFVEYLNIPLDSIEDIRITGSSANYNYTPQSDLDLHLIVDYEKVHEDCPIVEGYLWSMKSAFNKDHDISIYGIPVELYAEDSRLPATSNGVYSLVNREWIKFPEKIEPTDNDAAVQAKYRELKDASERIDDSEVAEELLDKIYAMRKAGLADGGEFSTENMAFKLLRNDGVIDKLKQLKKEKVDKELTLETFTKSGNGHICLKLAKGKNNYGFAGIRDNELYTDYNSKDCTQFKSFEDAKPIIDRYRKAGFTVTLLGTGKFSYLNNASKYKFESLPEVSSMCLLTENLKRLIELE